MTILRLDKKLTTTIEEENIFQEHVCKMTPLEFKVFCVIIEKAQSDYMHNLQYKNISKNAYYYDIDIRTIKNKLRSKKGLSYFLDVLESLKEKNIIDISDLKHGATTSMTMSVSFTDHKLWVEPNSYSSSEEKDNYIQVEYLIPCKSMISIFCVLAANKFQNSSKGYYINRKLLFKYLNLPCETKLERKTSKKQIQRILNNENSNFKNVKYENYHFCFNIKKINFSSVKKKEKSKSKRKTKKTIEKPLTDTGCKVVVLNKKEKTLVGLNQKKGRIRWFF